jgi:hypothetical protein
VFPVLMLMQMSARDGRRNLVGISSAIGGALSGDRRADADSLVVGRCRSRAGERRALHPSSSRARRPVVR